MNSRNLSRFHKFSGSNFKKTNIRNKNPVPIVSAQFADSDPEKNFRRKKIKIKIKKRKFYSNYTLSSSSFLFFWVVKTEVTLLF